MADIVITAANCIPDAGYQFRTEVAGATITAGQPCYLDSTDLVAGQGGSSASAKPADANASAAAATAVGIALHGASRGQPIILMTAGDVTIGGTSVAGESYFVSANPGGIAPAGDTASGWFIGQLGVGISTTKIRVKLNITGISK